MVQLKSFKYIESDADTTTTPLQQDNNSNNGQGTTESSSTRSTSTIVGGNLTGESSSQDQAAQNSEEDTISSSEEYQLARHDIIEEEDETAPSVSESVKQQDDNATTRIEINSGRAEIGQYQRPKQAPNTPRLKLFLSKAQTNSPTLSQAKCRSPPQLRHGTMSPASKRYAAILAGSNGGDNVSQYSFGQQKNTGNHFEIRWKRLRLFANRSKLPRFIAGNPVYKLLSKQQSPSLEEVCYSPPIQHKIPPTISEDLEINSKQLNTETITLSSMDQFGQPESGLRRILDNISGSVFSGQITAILGPSGVGKTTLLNSLTGRNTLDGTGRVSLIGGASKRMSVVTVPQIDILPDKLTTMEDLLFTSRLKNPQSGFDHKRNIERIVKHLHMDKFIHTRIDKLSGGEQRRLSIGRELLNSPDVMILDEPTSGLDANTCKKIITALRDIVEHSDNILDRPMSIIITIHQPQQEVYNLFHRVYVMAIGGRAIYEGPPNLLLPTLLEQSSLGRVCAVDQLNENPAIVAIEVASGEYGPNIIAELAVYHENQAYDELATFGDEVATASPLPTPYTFRSPLSVTPRLEMLHRKRLNSTDSSIGRPTPIMFRNFSGSQLDRVSNITNVSYASTYDADLPKQTSRLKVDRRLRRSVVMKSHLVSHTITLMNRCWLLATRDMFLMAIRIIGFVLVAAGTVQIFSNALDPEEHQCPQYESEVSNVLTFMQDIRRRLSGLLPMLQQSNSTHLFFFHVLLCIVMVTSALTGLVFPFQMRMFMREYKNGWYSPASFIISQTFAELPTDIIGPLITLIITYPLCHQPASEYHWREIGYGIVLVFSSIICKSQAQIVGAFLMDSVENSVFISCVAVTFPALLSGIPVQVYQMMRPLQLLSYTSFLRYAFESLMSLRYGYGMCPCDPDLVNGYPIKASSVALPAQLDNLARGFLALNQVNQSTTTTEVGTTTIESTSDLLPIENDENLFLKFIRLVTDASNLFVPNANDLGSCDNYRSLYLMNIDLPNNILPHWIGIMILMFIISRFLIYFVVKTVMKIRR